MSGERKGFWRWPFGHKLREVQPVDMEHLSRRQHEAAITSILEIAKARASGKSSGAHFFISARDLREGLGIDPETMAEPIKSRAKKYGLIAGRTMKDKQYFEKV